MNVTYLWRGERGLNVSTARAIAPDPVEERPENEYHGHQLRAKGEKSKITNSCERTHGD